MVLAAAALFVVSLGYGVVVPLLPALAGTQQASAVGMVYAVYAAAKIGAQLPGGAWVDRRGPDRVLAVALSLYTLSTVGFLLAWGPVWFGLMRVLEGAATGLTYPAVLLRVTLARGGQPSGRDLGTVVGLGTGGLLVGPALAGALAQFDPRAAVTVAAVLSAAVTLAVMLAKTPMPAASQHPVRSAGAEAKALWRLASDVAFVAAVVPVAFNKLTYSAMQGLLPLHGPAVLGLQTQGVTVLFALTGVVFGLAQPLGGALADRAGARTLVLTAAPLLLVGLYGMSLTSQPLAFGAAYLLYVATSSMVFAATLKHVAQSGGPGRWGSTFGLMGTLTDTMTVVGPLVFLGMYGGTGGNVFAVMAGVGVLSTVWFAWGTRKVEALRTPRPRPAEPM